MDVSFNGYFSMKRKSRVLWHKIRTLVCCIHIDVSYQGYLTSDYSSKLRLCIESVPPIKDSSDAHVMSSFEETIASNSTALSQRLHASS